MIFPILNRELGQAEREGVGGLSETNPETTVRSDIELSTLSPAKCFWASVSFHLHLINDSKPCVFRVLPPSPWFSKHYWFLLSTRKTLYL